MPDQFDQYAVKPQTPQATPVSSDPFEKYAVGDGAPPSAPVAPVSSSQGADPFAAYATQTPSPNNGQPAPAPPAQDENQPWYKKAFDWANTPLVDFNHAMSPEGAIGHAFGRTSEAGGFERGVENIVSGLTSPLSVALTAGTFGTGGLLESAGMTALKESGEFGAEELPQILKAAQTAVNAYKAAPEGATAIADAVKASGVDPALWNRAQKFLYDNGLTEHSLLGGDFLDRGAFQILRKTAPGWSIATTARAAETAKSIMSAGFTFQQLESASAMSPRFLDAIEEGDKDKAWEYGTEMFASGTLGILGASHALHSAGELFKPLVENDAFRPNDHWLQIDRANKEREAQHAEAEQEAINLDKSVREILGHSTPGFLESVFGGFEEAKNRKNLELATVFHNIVTGGDRVKAAQWYNALSEALGREERLPVPGEPGPNNGQVPPAAPNGDIQKLAENYTTSSGIDKTPHEGLESIDPEQAKKVADAYEAMEHNPDDPKTKAAYDALIKETKAQWDAAKAAGYKLEPWTEPGQPYANSRDMAEDVRNNKHLFYFQGGDVPEGHPLGGIDPETGETYNNIFRAVHDLFGHAKNGYEFGPRGEENAFLAHSKMYSDEAIPALLTETKGQNSWVNFGGHLRDENGNLPAKGEAGFVPPAERPYADQKAGILPPEIINPHLQNGPKPEVGEPTETPDKSNTKLMHSNDSGQLRLGSDKRPVVWLSPKAWASLMKIISPDNSRFSGFSFDGVDSSKLENLLPKNSEIRDLVSKARYLSEKNLLTAATTDHPQMVRVVSEELHHTAQRELSSEGKVENHLNPEQFSRLRSIIPTGWTKVQDRLGYDKDPAVRVVETAAQFMAERYLDEPGAVTKQEVDDFLKEYFKELVTKYGPDADKIFNNINEISQQHVEDINAAQKLRTSQSGVSKNIPEISGSLSEGPGQRDIKGTARDTGRENGPEGLASREEDQEFSKLSGLRLRVGMGDAKSAGLVTGDNEVLIGRDHADLAREAGYKATKQSDLYNEMFRDGGVRIRTAGGVVHIDFMEPNADTWDRVYRSIKSVPDANKYYVDFRPLKGGTGFNISAYDKDDLLYRLKNLEEGNERPVRPGSVAAFRQGLFSRNYDVQETEDPEKFYDAINKVKEAHAEQGTDKQLHVYSPKEYAGMKTFLSPDGKTGFALKGDDIVSVFSHPTDTPGAAAHLLDVAVKNGGRRLDAFDTYLPKIYAREGFRVVARMPWNDAYAPEGWDHEAMKQYNNGRPDVVFMAFDPAHASATGGKLVGSYAEAEKLQKAAEEPATASALFSRPNNGQDPQLAHQIDTNVFKNQPKDYQDLVMESLRRNAAGELSDREIAASKRLRDEQDRNYEIGSSNDLLHHYIEDYMTRVYKDTNPAGQVILSDAKGGKFATNVSMAKQRVYDSNLTALLKSPKQMLLDPVDITARGRASLIKAAANRQLIDSLRDKFTRASDGRPAVVLSGSGQVVSGQNGEDPRIFVDPNRVRKINIDPKVIKDLSASGELERHLASGTIRDITPYVRPNNIGAAIDRLEEQAGRSTPIPDEHGQNPLRTQIMMLKSMQANGDFSGLKDFNDALEKKYAWDPQDYVSLANNAMKGWNFITNSPDGTPVYVRSDIKVHPEFAEYLQNRLGLKESDISKNPVGKALLGAGTKLKHTLLSMSPFHMVQEALRGIMVGVNPFHITAPDILTGEKIDPADPNSPTIIRKAVENGFTTGTDYKSLQSHSEGLSSGGGILDKIPGVGKVIGNSLNWYQDFLFKRYIPALKARSVELMYHEYQRLHPDWTVDHVAKAAAVHANDTFGGVNWKAMGRSATTQDWGRLMFLAPDWLESEMRSGARLFNKDEGGLGRAQVAKMALGLWGIARVLNLVTTGNAHYEAPFGLATKNKEGKETVFSIRTLPTDILHSISDPVGFLKGRLSPTVRLGTEAVTGRDQYGRKLQPSELWVDVFHQMMPIPVQSVGQAVSGLGPDVGNIGQAVKAVGGTATTYRTPAQKMAADLASSHNPDGPVDPMKMERHRRIIDIEDKARLGEISWPELYRLAYATDQISPEELKQIENNVKSTHGMDPGMASLYTRASRLPAKEYLDLLDAANNSERASLAPLTLKVQKRYLMKAKKEMTPEERSKDPVFQRLIRMIPEPAQK